MFWFFFCLFFIFCRATSLGPKPSLFFCVLFFGFFFLALSPRYLFVLFVFCLFVLFFLFVLSFLCFWVKNQFPIKRDFFCLFLSVSLCFSWVFFGLPLVQFLFLCLSRVLFFLSSFLSFFSCFLLVPSFSLFLSFSLFFAFVSWKLTTSKDSIAKLFFINSVSFLVSCLVFSCKSLFLIFVFSWYSVMLFVQHQCFWFQKTQVEKHYFLVKRGVATKRLFFNNLCFAKCEKLSFFLGPFFGQILVDVQKNTINIGISAHFQKPQERKNDHFEGLLSGPSLLQHQNGQLGPDNNLSNFCAHFFFKKKCWTPFL